MKYQISYKAQFESALYALLPQFRVLAFKFPFGCFSRFTFKFPFRQISRFTFKFPFLLLGPLGAQISRFVY